MYMYILKKLFRCSVQCSKYRGWGGGGGGMGGISPHCLSSSLALSQLYLCYPPPLKGRGCIENLSYFNAYPPSTFFANSSTDNVNVCIAESEKVLRYS